MAAEEGMEMGGGRAVDGGQGFRQRGKRTRAALIPCRLVKLGLLNGTPRSLPPLFIDGFTRGNLESKLQLQRLLHKK
jgi:hypothetical protein